MWAYVTDIRSYETFSNTIHKLFCRYYLCKNCECTEGKKIDVFIYQSRMVWGMLTLRLSM